MDGALKGTDNESFPKPTEIGGYAGVPAPPPPPPPAPPPPPETVIQPTIEVAPGITIPVGPPTPPCPSDHLPARRAGRPSSRYRSVTRARRPAAAVTDGVVTTNRRSLRPTGRPSRRPAVC